jgi:hypothetical protein
MRIKLLAFIATHLVFFALSCAIVANAGVPSPPVSYKTIWIPPEFQGLWCFDYHDKKRDEFNYKNSDCEPSTDAISVKEKYIGFEDFGCEVKKILSYKIATYGPGTESTIRVRSHCKAADSNRIIVLIYELSQYKFHLSVRVIK